MIRLTIYDHLSVMDEGRFREWFVKDVPWPTPVDGPFGPVGVVAVATTAYRVKRP